MFSVASFANPGSHFDLMHNFLSHLFFLVEPANVYFSHTLRLKCLNLLYNTYYFGVSSWMQNFSPNPHSQPNSSGVWDFISGGVMICHLVDSIKVILWRKFSHDLLCVVLSIFFNIHIKN